MESVVELDDGNFHHEVIESEQPVLVEFWDDSCLPCATLTKVLDELADQYKGRAKIAHMDVQTNINTICSIGVAQLPAVLVFQNGNIVDRFVGEEPRGVYCEAIDGTLALNWVI
jgi:thioredoxin 1